MACAAFLYTREKTRCASGLIRLAAEYGQIQNKLLKEFILPYALLDMKGGILWMNNEFAALTGKDNDFHKNVAAVFPQITNSNLPGKDAQTEVTVVKDDRKYRAAMTLVDAGGLFGEDAEETGDEDDTVPRLPKISLRGPRRRQRARAPRADRAAPVRRCGGSRGERRREDRGSRRRNRARDAAFRAARPRPPRL